MAAIDDPSRIRRSRDIGTYLGLVPRRYQSGEVDYTGGISKCGDGRVRTLLYEAANVMLTRYKGQLKLKDWAFAIAKRSTMRKARVALARRLAIIMHAMLRDGTEMGQLSGCWGLIETAGPMGRMVLTAQARQVPKFVLRPNPLQCKRPVVFTLAVDTYGSTADRTENAFGPRPARRISHIRR